MSLLKPCLPTALRCSGWRGPCLTRAALAAGFAISLAGSVSYAAVPDRQAGQDVGSSEIRSRAGLHPGENLLFNGWGVTPAGQHVPVSDMPLKLALSPDGKMLAAVCAGFNHTGLELVSLSGTHQTQFFPLAYTWNGIAFSADGSQIFVSGGESGLIYSFRLADGKASPEKAEAPASGVTHFFPGGMALHPTTGKLYVCSEGTDEVWVLNPETLKREASIPTGAHPHSCAFGADKRHLYVTDWGGRSVTVLDTMTAQRVRDISVGIRPNDLALAPDGRLFVACSGDNTVHVIQTRSLETPEAQASPTRRPPEGVREILSTSLYPSSPEGSTPDGVAVAPDGKTLYVVNADNNDVMVVDISDPAVSRVAGFIPVGWYPTAAIISPDGATILVADGKGLRFGPNAKSGPATTGAKRRSKKPSFTYIGNMLQGSISFIPRPGAAELARYTAQVRLNSPYTPETLRRAPLRSRGAIPETTRENCPIKYVLYIIKENRTYDQVFGDLKDAHGKALGNGDPDLVMYGEDVTPNHHQLARDYVTLDNLYCNGEVSVDGHSWCDAAIATDFNQRRWIMSYSKHGDLPGNQEMERPAQGYLWDLCQRQGVPFKCYGEGSGEVPTINRGTWPGGRDMNRVDGWIGDLKAAEGTGVLPQFMIMSLGEDHTSGTTPGKHTPNASVASNDIGLGKIVEAATHSRFWPQLAIFVIEDDAQNGPDHVDAHRTAGLVISPYTRRGVVDSTLYTTASMVRTMELILGLPPLTQYDAGATPLFNSFQGAPQAVPYTLLKPAVDVEAVNTPRSPGAQISMTMDFDEYDRAPEAELNQVLWLAAKGPGVPYPAPIHRVLFTR